MPENSVCRKKNIDSFKLHSLLLQSMGTKYKSMGTKYKFIAYKYKLVGTKSSYITTI